MNKFIKTNEEKLIQKNYFFFFFEGLFFFFDNLEGQENVTI